MNHFHGNFNSTDRLIGGKYFFVAGEIEISEEYQSVRKVQIRSGILEIDAQNENGAEMLVRIDFGSVRGTDRFSELKAKKIRKIQIILLLNYNCMIISKFISAFLHILTQSVNFRVF